MQRTQRFWLLTHRVGRAADHCIVPDLEHVIDEVAQTFGADISLSMQHAIADAMRLHAVPFLSGDYRLNLTIGNDPTLSTEDTIVSSVVELVRFDVTDKMWFGNLSAE
jgi:hypothetical protein